MEHRLYSLAFIRSEHKLASAIFMRFLFLQFLFNYAHNIGICAEQKLN